MNKTTFFDQIRNSLFGGRLTQKQVEGIEAIIDYCASGVINDDRHLAYILATAFHETARTFEPVEEFGKGAKRKYGRKVKLNGMPYTTPDHIYYGRGLVQLTWYDNYQSVGRRIGVDLLNNPEKAMDLDVSVKILVEGMKHGWFTGRRLANFFTAKTSSPKAARRIINGTDKASLIAGYYRTFLAAILAAKK